MALEKEIAQISDVGERIDALIDRYGNEILRLAFTYVKHYELAEDIAQETFIRCYEKISNFRHESSYRTWLYRITINLCKNRLKSWSFRHLIFSDNVDDSSHEQTGERQLLEKEEMALVSCAVLRLPIKYREVVMLRYGKELTFAEMATVLNKSESTLKSRLQRAHELLKKELEDEFIDR